MATPYTDAQGIEHAGGLLHYFYILDEWSILPSLIFMGVGAMTDFGPLIANPIQFLMRLFAGWNTCCIFPCHLPWLQRKGGPASISIIGGADGPTSIFLCGKLGQTQLMGPIAVAAYSYMSLVPIIQPPIMKLFTTEKEKDQDGTASSCFQTGEDPVPNRYHNSCMSASSYNSSTCWYADAG